MASEQDQTLPRELRVFLHTCVESIQQVELLILMRGSENFRTARDIASELGASVAIARRDLETLAARGLMEVKVGKPGDEMSYRYRPKSDDLARYGDLLARYYITARQAVLGFVAAESRLSIKSFSDAFKLRDPKK